MSSSSMEVQLLATSTGFSACGIGTGKDIVVPPSPLLLTNVVHQPLRLHERRLAAGKFRHQEAEHNLG